MVLKIIFIIVISFFVLQIVFRLFRKNIHFPAPAFIGRFLDTGFRRKMQPPDKLMARSGVKSGMHILEIGCGSGAFTTHFARVVGESGKVYALDIQPGMLKQLENKLSKQEYADIKNIKLINASAYELPFSDESINLVYMITVFQEIPDRMKALQEIRRVLKPGGILAISEFLPDPDYPLSSTTAKFVIKAGFKVDKIEGGLWNYTVRFIKL